MRIKVSDHFMYAVSTNHIRQWCEALISLPDIVYIPEQSDEWADIGIDSKDNVGLSVFIELSDPDCLLNLIQVDDLQKRWGHLLPTSYKKPSEAFKHHFGASITAGYYDDWQVTTFIVWSPLQDILLKSAKYHLPHSLPEIHFYSKPNQVKEIDILLCGNTDPNWYPLRHLMWSTIMKSGLSFSSYTEPGWVVLQKTIANKERGSQIEAYEKQLQEYSTKLRQAKIMVFDGGVFDYPVKKYIEAMACGCLVLAPMPLDADLMGFVDGVNMIVVDETNFMEKCRYYLEHEQERKQITDAAYNLYLERHTCQKSAEKFLQYLKTR